MTCLKRIGIAALALALFGVATVPASAQEDAAVRDPNIVAMKDRGDELAAEGKFADAVDAYSEAINSDPDNPYLEAMVARADALKDMGDFSEAIRAYSQVLNLTNDMAAAFNGRGEAYMEMSPPDYNLALNDFGYALRLERRNPAILSNYGHVVAAMQSDPATALARLNEALAINPEDARAYRDRGLAHAQLQDFDNAIVDLQKASELNSGDYENYVTLAEVYRYKDEYPNAIGAISSAIANYKPEKPTDPKTFVGGYITRALFRLTLAEREVDAETRTAVLEGIVADTDSVLESVESLTLEAGQAMYLRGRAERMLERFSAAVDSLTRAIQIGVLAPDVPYVSNALLFRGICWYYIGSLELARGDFEQAASVGSGFGDPKIPLWIGITYHREGDYRLAIESYSEAIAKAPNFSLAHINKGRAYMDLGEYRKAIESFGHAIRSEPGVGEHYYNVGLAYLQLDEFQKAVDFLNLALRQENPKPKFYSQMAVALRGIGRDDLAPEYERRATEVESATP